MANEFIRTAWFAERFGLDPGVAHKDLDDWCPTGATKPKLPPWWPPIPEPEPHPDWALDYHLALAARLSVIAVEGGVGTPLGASLEKAIDQSVVVIEYRGYVSELGLAVSLSPADDRQELDVEDQRRAAGNGTGGLVAVGDARGTDQAGLSFNLHPLESLGPAADDSVKRELGGLVPFV